MKKIETLYNNLIALLTQITYDGPSFSDFHDGLIEVKQAQLVDISERILNEKREISKAKLHLEFYPDFTSLITHLDDFKDLFDDFPGFRKNEIYAIISIIQKLTVEYGGTTFDLEEEIDETEFDLLELTHEINKDNFFVFDSVTFSHSLFLFNITKKEDFKNYIDSITSGTQILFYLLTKVGRPLAPLANTKYILVDKNFVTKPKHVWATLCLHIVKAGETIHKSYVYNYPPRISPNTVITLGETYQQFYDSIDIISEYNYQKDILDKYLRIYHVLENFMYKSPLVNLEREANGQVFSIREFKRMYDKINDSELNMLKKLFEDILTLDYSVGVTFKAKILSDWTGLIPGHFVDNTNINLLIKKLNITTSKGANINHSYVNADTLINFFPKLIYSFRNSMVHNRETEFHLTHMNLINHPVMMDTAKKMLEIFLIPTLEEIVFHLIANQNSVVWYDQSKLSLWEEN